MLGSSTQWPEVLFGQRRPYIVIIIESAIITQHNSAFCSTFIYAIPTQTLCWKQNSKYQVRRRNTKHNIIVNSIFPRLRCHQYQKENVKWLLFSYALRCNLTVFAKYREAYSWYYSWIDGSSSGIHDNNNGYEYANMTYIELIIVFWIGIDFS